MRREAKGRAGEKRQSCLLGGYVLYNLNEDVLFAGFAVHVVPEAEQVVRQRGVVVFLFGAGALEDVGEVAQRAGAFVLDDVSVASPYC